MAILFVLIACSPVTNIVKYPSSNLTVSEYRVIGVMPFAGDAPVRNSASEWFAFVLRKHGKYKVVDPATVSILARNNALDIMPLRKEGAGERIVIEPQEETVDFHINTQKVSRVSMNSYPAEAVQRVGKAIGADAMVAGAVYRRGNSLNTSVEVRLIDVRSKEVIAIVHTTLIAIHKTSEKRIQEAAVSIVSALQPSGVKAQKARTEVRQDGN